MKKNYLLLIVLVLSTGLAYGQSARKNVLRTVNQSVQVQNTNRNEVTPLLEKAEKANMDVQTASLGSLKEFKFSGKNLAPAATIEAEYHRPWGSLLRTALIENNGGLAKYNQPLLVVPARKTLPFAPWASDRDAVFTWSITNPSTGQETDLADQVEANGVLNYYFDFVVPQGYSAFIPELKATVGADFGTYKYGQEVSAGASFNASPNNITDPTLNYTLTDCDTHLGGGPYSGFRSGESFGSNYDIGGVPAQAVMSTYEAPLGVLSFNSIDVLATNDPGTEAIPEGKSLNLSIHYIADDGSIEETAVATAIATAGDVKLVNWASFINFKFVEVIDGFETDQIVQIQDRPYAVIVQGFDATWDINFLFSDAHGWAGSAYTINNGQIKTIGYGNQPQTPQCVLLFAFNGVFNCFEVETETNNLTVPNGGGLAANDEGEYGTGVFSTFGVDELEIVEKSDWITKIEYDDTYFENYNVLYFVITGDALPADKNGRTGKVVLGSFGRTITIDVVQGNVSGISIPNTLEAIKATRQGDNFMLSHPASATSVSVYNVAGLRVGDYQLNATGKTTIPAGDWSKGVYVLKFAGKTNGTVKVIK